MLFNSYRSFFAVFIVLLVWGCTPFKPLPEHALQGEGTTSLEVPYVPQIRDNDCGPAALASLLKYYGKEVILEEVTNEIYIPALKRTLLPDMENFARAQGFETDSGRGDISLLRQAIDAGIPVIVLMETGSGVVRRPHYIVITGYTQDGFLAHAGVMKNVFMGFDEFDRKWRIMNRLYLMITHQTPQTRHDQI